MSGGVCGATGRGGRGLRHSAGPAMAAETGRYSAGASAVGLVGRDWRCWVCILGGSCAGLRDGYPTVYLSSPYRAKSKQKLGVAWYAHSARLSRSHTPQSVPKHQSDGGQRIPPRPRQRQVQIFAGAHSHPMMSLDAHERPPDHIRNAYKKYQKLRGSALDNDPQLLDLRARTSVDQLQVVRSLSPKALGSVFRNFMPDSSCDSLAPSEEPVPVYEHRHMPGRHNFVLWIICVRISLILTRSAYHTLPLPLFHPESPTLPSHPQRSIKSSSSNERAFALSYALPSGLILLF